MVPQVVRLYEQMAEPKYVIAMGACACGGGPFKEGYSVVSGVDKFLPVDVYIPGCPLTPEAFLSGFLVLFEQVQKERISQVRWYREEPIPEIPVPLLGPDLIDVRQIPEIGGKGTDISPTSRLQSMPTAWRWSITCTRPARTCGGRASPLRFACRTGRSLTCRA